MRPMASVGHKFTAVVTALVVLVTHAMCVCRSMAAAVHAVAPANAHLCCTNQDKPAPDSNDHPARHEGSCRHCDGIAAPAVKAAEHGAADALALSLVAPPVVDASSLDSLPLSPARSKARPAEFFSPPTLLRLCCALNL
jgi:hypothetical protein